MAASHDEQFMRQALALAEMAAVHHEVPVGAVIVRDGCVIGQGHNQPISTADPTAHAEIQAIRAAAQQINNYRLTGSTLYVTLEPCLMCYGAIVHARVARVVYAASDPKVAVCRRPEVQQCFAALNHVPVVMGGVCANESQQLLRDFFRERRSS